MVTRMQQRRDTTANWAAENPIMRVGEMGYDTDVDRFKIGDGVTQWLSLPFLLDSELTAAQEAADAAAASADAASDAAAVAGANAAVAATAALAPFVENINGQVDAAADSAAAAQAAAEEASTITGLTGEDDAVALLIATPATDTAKAISTRLREFDPREYGAKWDNVTDDYEAFKATLTAATNWIVGGGKAKVVMPDDIAYMGKPGGGGLLINPAARGLIIEGQGEYATGLRLSKEVLRAFDLLTYNAVYEGLRFRKFFIDADNVDDTDVGPVTTCSAATITGSSTTTDITVASTAGWATKGRCLFPSANGGTAKGLTFPFVVLDATHIRVTNYGSTVTVLNGDSVQGAINDHLIVGTQSGISVTQSTDIIDVEVSDVRVINVPTKPVASFTADQPHVRWGSCIAPRTATAPVPPTLVKDITFRRVKIYGGECGLYVGSFGTAPQNIQCWLDNILYDECYHSTLVLPTANYFSLNYEIGGSGSGNRSLIRHCYGWGSGDVGVEVNGMLDHVTEDCLMEEFQGIGYYQANYGIPCDSPAGPPTMLLSASISDTSTTATIVGLPTTEGIPVVGYAVVDTEVIQYTVTSDTTLTLVRGFNGSTAAAHASTTPIRTFPVHRQKIKTVRSRGRLRQITPDPATPGRMPPIFSATSQSARYPHAPVSIRDCEAENSLSMMGNRTLAGEIVHVSGWTPEVDIDGLHIERHGFVYTTLDARTGAAIVVKSVNTGATGPQTLVKLDRIRAIISGRLATGASAPTYAVIAPDTGRWVMDWGSIIAEMRLRNPQPQSTWGIVFAPTGAAMRIHGVCRRFRLVTPVSGDGAPRVLLCNGTFTLDHFDFEDLDLTDMWFGQGTGNPNYQPITASSLYAPFVSVRKWRHPSIIAATTAYAQRTNRRRTVYNVGVTLAATDEYVAATLSAPGTFTLRPAAATGASALPNPGVGKEVWIKDEGNTAATNPITVAVATGETLDGVVNGTKVINTNGGVLRLMAVSSATVSGWVTV